MPVASRTLPPPLLEEEAVDPVAVPADGARVRMYTDPLGGAVGGDGTSILSPALPFEVA